MRPVRVAMWSGPRNISTALMRSFGARPDTFVVDEPLYAHFLASTGRAHPGADEVIAAGETDWRVVVRRLVEDEPGAAVFYQKHMTHHLLPHVERGWVRELRNAFLIREPRALLASLARNLPDATLADTGLPQQVELFRQVRAHTGRVPPVVEARDVLRAPGIVLPALCAALDIPWTPAMLSWAPGPRDTDGIWARHWYASVYASTGFRDDGEREVELPASLEALYGACVPFYDELHAYRLEG